MPYTAKCACQDAQDLLQGLLDRWDEYSSQRIRSEITDCIREILSPVTDEDSEAESGEGPQAYSPMLDDPDD